jgi:hypothetical protein
MKVGYAVKNVVAVKKSAEANKRVLIQVGEETRPGMGTRNRK